MFTAFLYADFAFTTNGHMFSHFNVRYILVFSSSSTLTNRAELREGRSVVATLCRDVNARSRPTT